MLYKLNDILIGVCEINTLLFWFYFIFIYVLHMFLYVFVCIHMCMDAHRSQKRTSDPCARVPGSYKSPDMVLITDLQSSAIANALNC